MALSNAGRSLGDVVEGQLTDCWNRTSIPVAQEIPCTGSPVDKSNGDRSTGVVGEIVARMAKLWDVVIAKASDPDEFPDAQQLLGVCDTYDRHAVAMESGQRTSPGL